MNHEIFFENFELLVNAPNGVQKLREMILLLAVQGKLVPQDSGDESAAVLLEKINLEKDRLLRDKKIKNQKQLTLIEPEELPFDLPNSWKWMRLGEVVDYNGALKVSPNKIPDESWLLELEDIEKNTSKIIKRVLFRVRKSKSTKTKFEKSDVLYGKLRPYLNKVVLADEEGFCTTEIIPLHGYIGIFPKYLMYSLKRPDFLKYVNSKTYGINLPRLGTEDARSALFPLPPFEEQKRIVAKVDQLMALCDQLEARQQKKHEQRIRLNNAALDKLLTALTPDEFAQHWQRICDNFDLLYDVPETVSELRKAILQFAVMGKLVAQDPNDEPAVVLLEKIKAEKEKLVKEGVIRKGKPLTSIKEEETPYKLPKEWQWVRLDDLVSLLGDGLHGTPKYSDCGDYYFINGNNLSNGKILIKNNTKRASIDEYNRYKKKLDERTVLVSINGTLGNVAFYNNEKIILGKSACYFNLLHNTNKLYLKLLINTSYFLEYAFKNATGSTIKNVSLKSMRLFLVPLPPLQEQRRIVTRVDQLVALCDELEAGLVQAQTEAGKLMEAVVHHVLAE